MCVDWRTDDKYLSHKPRLGRAVVTTDIETDIAAPGAARTVMNDLIGGGVCSVLQISYCLSYAALIFSGPLARSCRRL